MTTRSTLLLAHAALFSVAIFYGINYFTLKGVFVEGYNNFAILSIRCMVAVLFFVGFHALFIKEKVRERKDYLRLLLCGLFGVALNQTFFLWGLSNTGPVHSSVLMITTPVFVFAVAALLKEERITPRKILGLMLAFAGAAALILIGNKGPSDENSVIGDLMIMFNAASYAMYLVLVKPLARKYNTFTIVKWIFIFGGIPNILIGLPPLLQSDFTGISGAALFGIVFLILGATLSAYFLNAWSMKKVNSSAVGMYIYLQPVFVNTGAIILGRESLEIGKLALILLIFTGVFLVSTQKLQKA